MRGRWCSLHAEQLDRVKGELEVEMARVRQGRSMSRKCRSPGCDEFRMRGSGYCTLHDEEAVIE